MGPGLKRWDLAEYLTTDDEIAGQIEAAFEDYDPFHLARTFESVARALGVRALAERSGLSREQVLEALNGDGYKEENLLHRLAESYGVSVGRLAPAAE